MTLQHEQRRHDDGADAAVWLILVLLVLIADGTVVFILTVVH